MNRPIGITILAILDIIFGIIMVMGAISLMVLAEIIGEYISEFGGLPGYSLILGAMGGIFSIILFAIAVIEFVMAWGLLGGKGWAWIITIVFSAIAILMGLLSLPLGLIGMAINALIIYYLFRPHVKTFFGRREGPYEAQPIPPPPPETIQQIPTCPRCGRALTYIEQYQRWYCYDCQQYL